MSIRRIFYVAIVIGSAAGLLWASTGRAQDPDPCRLHTVAASVGTNSAGTFTFCMRTDGEIERHAQSVQVSATLTSSAALTGANPSITLSINDLVGCAASAPDTAGTAPGAPGGATASSTWLVTLTGERCTFYVRMTATSGSTTVSDMTIAGNVAIRENWTAIIYEFSWLIWIIGALLTRAIGNLPVRIVADFVLDGILFLPMEDQQRLFLMGAGVFLVAVDLVLLIMAANKMRQQVAKGRGRRRRNGRRTQ